jgi:hypothetical protein
MLMAACAFNLNKLPKYAKKPIKMMTRHLVLSEISLQTLKFYSPSMINQISYLIRPSKHILQKYV